MYEFLTYKFFEHPRFHPKLLTHLFETTAPKALVEGMKAKVGVLELQSRT